MITNSNNITISLKMKHVSLLYFAILFLSYSPVFLFDYAFSDDWSTLANVFAGEDSPFAWDMQSGRPLYAVARHYGFMLINGMGDLAILRIFSLVTIFIFCCYLYDFIDRRNVFDNIIAKITFPLLMCSIPAVQVYSAWATCFPFMLSILLAGVSYSISNPVNKRSTITRALISVMILWAAFSIYQPTAMSFLFFVMLDNCINKNKTLSVSKIASNALIMSAGMLGSLVISKWVPVWIYGSALPRSELSIDIYGKSAWFMDEVLPNAINNFNIDPYTPYTIFSSILAIIGLVAIGRGKSGIIKVIILIGMGIGAYLPNLLIKENWAAFRSLIALELFTCTLVILGVMTIAKKLKMTGPLMPTLVLFIMTSVSYNIINSFVLPQKSELNALATALSEKVSKSYTGRVMFDITDAAYYAFTKTQRFDEFGNISLATPWSVKGMAEQIKINKSMNFTVVGDGVLTPKEQCTEDCILIKTSDYMRKATYYY